MTSTNWGKIVHFDRAYLSHRHTLETAAELVKTFNFQQTGVESVGSSEYRSSFLGVRRPSFAVTTVIAVDSSTYTYIHLLSPLPVDKIQQEAVIRLPNADIKMPHDRSLREVAVKQALERLGVLPVPIKKEKSDKPQWPRQIIAADGSITYDYSRLPQPDKIAGRTLDYQTMTWKTNEKPKENPGLPEDDKG